MSYRGYSTAELVFRAIGAVLVLTVISFGLDTLCSWLFELAFNHSPMHTHFGTFSLFWIVVVANFWLSLNLAASLRSKKS
jgi:hypothetical protein